MRNQRMKLMGPEVPTKEDYRKAIRHLARINKKTVKEMEDRVDSLKEEIKSLEDELSRRYIQMKCVKCKKNLGHPQQSISARKPFCFGCACGSVDY